MSGADGGPTRDEAASWSSQSLPGFERQPASWLLPERRAPDRAILAHIDGGRFAPLMHSDRRARFAERVAVERDEDTGDRQPDAPRNKSDRYCFERPAIWEQRPGGRQAEAEDDGAGSKPAPAGPAIQTISSAGIGRPRCSMSLMCPGEKKTCAIAVGMIADRTTIVTSSENWVLSMMPAFSP